MRSLLAIVALLAFAAPAHAQMADALGKPLPKADLPTGTVTVRVVAGDLAKPAATDVRLRIDGGAEEKVGRTDGSGRATFSGLKPGAKVQAFTAGDQGDVSSEVFEVPAQGGAAVMLSTRPLAGGGPMTGPMGGMPEPRQMAGQPRAEQNDPAGALTVRLSYNDLARTEGIADRPVVVVKYHADDSIKAQVKRTDAAGRVTFEPLDTSGNAAYYALALLPRGGGHDRLMSLPIVPGEEVGMRVMLSGEKADSGKPPVDDLERFSRQAELPAGQVVVAIAGEPPDQGEVELLDALTGEVVGKAPLGRGRALPSSVDATFREPQLQDDLAAGTVQLAVAVVAGNQRLGLPRSAVTVKGGTYLSSALTDADGNVTLTGAPIGVPLVATVDVQGKTFASQPFTLGSAKGVLIDVATRFELLSLVEAAFENVPASPEGAYLAQLRSGGQLYRSPPFQMAPERGVVAPIFVMPRIEATFQIDATFEDDFLAARGNFLLQNAAWAPYAGPSEGIRIPAPRGATGLVVADMDKQWVAVDSSGFRLTRAVPPFGGDFRAAFSLPVEDGRVVWDMPLPLGARGSSLAILQTDAEMRVNLPAGVSARPIKQPNGTTWIAIQRIEIPPNQRMVFDVTGLPMRPAWYRVSRQIAGYAVLLLLAAGIAFGIYRRAAPATAPVTTKKQRKRRVEELLDRIATLDKTGGDAAEREKLVAELERLYREDAA